MSVYVDDMKAEFKGIPWKRTYVMCHMIADSSEELLAMADQIGVQRKWLQSAGTYREHFDICKSKRVLAVKNGAKEITMLELGRKLRERVRQ